VWWRRWGTYGHRLRTELARLGYGLGQLLMHR